MFTEATAAVSGTGPQMGLLGPTTVWDGYILVWNSLDLESQLLHPIQPRVPDSGFYNVRL